MPADRWVERMDTLDHRDVPFPKADTPCIRVRTVIFKIKDRHLTGVGLHQIEQAVFQQRDVQCLHRFIVMLAVFQ